MGRERWASLSWARIKGSCRTSDIMRNNNNLLAGVRQRTKCIQRIPERSWENRWCARQRWMAAHRRHWEMASRRQSWFIGSFIIVTGKTRIKDWLEPCCLFSPGRLQNGTLKITDRKKNIFKMAQGEYIAPEKIEMIYNLSEPVAQIFVHGDSLQVWNCWLPGHGQVGSGRNCTALIRLPPVYF